MTFRHVDQALLTALFAIGTVAGLGQLLAGKDEPTLGQAVGRAVTSGILATSAGLALAWMPALDPTAILGLGAALASLGTSGIEKLLARFVK